MAESPNDSALLARLDERTIAIQRDLTEMKAAFNSWDSRIGKLERDDAAMASRYVSVDSQTVKSVERWERFEQRLLAYGVAFGFAMMAVGQLVRPLVQKYLGF